MAECWKCENEGSCVWASPKKIICSGFVQKPFTNADRIRAMSDEELAKWASAITRDEFGDKKDWLYWLKKEADHVYPG